MKIGIIKTTELNNGFSGDFWRMGTTILPYDETVPTDFTRPLKIQVQMYLYMDFNSYVNNLYSMTTIWVDVYLSYDMVMNNAFDNILDALVSNVDGYFYGCEIYNVELS